MPKVNQRTTNISHTGFVIAFCFGLLACSTPPPEAKTAPSPTPTEVPPAPTEVTPAPTQVAKAQTPEASDAPARIEELSFVPGELTSKSDPAVLEYCLDCQVRKARYTYCHFDTKELQTAVGPESFPKMVTVKVEMRAQSSETYVPEDPNAPQPDDGFVHEKYKCMVVEVLSSK